MKRKHIILLMALVVSGMFTMQGCKKDESPTPVIYKAFTTPACTTSPAADANGIVHFTGTTVDLVWTSETGGNADNWDVYFGPAGAVSLVKSGVTAQKYTVTVADGVTYDWRVEVKDARGMITKSATNEFTAVNGSNPAMSVSLTVTTDVKTVIGVNYTADQVVDLRMLILKKSDMSVAAVEDNGNADETYSGFGALPDDEYVIGVDIYSTKNFGDINKPINLSFALQFDQLGITNLGLSYPNVMTNANPCNLYRTYLAVVTKVGSEYTIKSEVSYMTPPVLTWNGTDATYPSEVTTTESCGGKTMTGLINGWMLDWWGETIVDGGTLKYTDDGTTLDIPYQYYCTTTYKGVQQTPYYIQGTGTVDNSGAYPVYTIHYDINQGGTWIGAYSFIHYGWTQDGFDAVLTTAPGKKSLQVVNHPAKPRR